jgi:multisubunit Na+/H+ antiporter MnhC subunit
MFEGGLYPYWIVIFLMMTGLYVVISRDNLVKKIIGLNIFQVSVIMFYVAMGKVQGGTAPIHHHVADHYIEDTDAEIGVPNMVTAILASYRGYDTWGETTVIFTACVGVLLLLGGGRTYYRWRHRDDPAAESDGP